MTSTQDRKRKIQVPDPDQPHVASDLEKRQVRTSGVALLASRGP